MIELDKGRLWSEFLKLKISQNKLAKKCGLDFRTINRALHNGQIMPSKLQRLANGLEVDALDLMKRRPQ